MIYVVFLIGKDCHVGLLVFVLVTMIALKFLFASAFFGLVFLLSYDLNFVDLHEFCFSFFKGYWVLCCLLDLYTLFSFWLGIQVFQTHS